MINNKILSYTIDDDINHSNKVVTNQLLNSMKRNNIDSIETDIWCYGNHWHKFINEKGSSPKWISDNHERNSEAYAELLMKNDILSNREYHKMVIFTFRSLCNKNSEAVEKTDDPIELLKLADDYLQKLIQEQYEDNNVNGKVD